MLHNNTLLEACRPNRICGCIVEVKPKLSLLWCICTSLARCIQTQARKGNTHTSTLFVFLASHTRIIRILPKWACHFMFCCYIKELTCSEPLHEGHTGVTPCHRYVTQMPGISAMSPDTLPTDLTSCIHMSFPQAHSCGRKKGDGGPLPLGVSCPIPLL